MEARTRFKLEPYTQTAQSVASEADLFIYAVGYEARSSYFVDQCYQLNCPFAAVVYVDTPHLGRYSSNLEKFKSRNHVNIGYKIEEISERLKLFLADGGSGRTIVVDISCLDRTVMSNIFISLFSLCHPLDRFYIIYTPNKYAEPEISFPPLRYFGPAAPQLSGNVGEIHRQRCLIMGLGYEYGSSLNVLEQMEPSVSYLYRPNGFDSRFIRSVEKANFGFDFGERNVHLDDYSLSDTVAVYQDISAIVLSLKHSMSIMLVPFGPKIFSFACLLVALENVGDVAFLRYSVSNDETANVLEASGEMCGMFMTGIDKEIWGKARLRGRTVL